MVAVPYPRGFLSERDEKAFFGLAADIEHDYPGHDIIFLGLVGSHSYREPDQFSDIDVYVIVDELEIWKHGKTRKEGAELEYFIYSPDMVMRMMEEEGRYRPVTAHMLYWSKYLLLNEEKMLPILQKANEIIGSDLPELTEIEKDRYKWQLSELVQDLHDMSNPLHIFLTHAELVDCCIEIFLRLNRRWRERIKELDTQLENLDPRFSKFLKSATRSPDHVGELVDYVEELLGGRRPIEWMEEGKVDELS